MDCYVIFIVIAIIIIMIIIILLINIKVLTQWSMQCQKSKYCPVQLAVISSPGLAAANLASTLAVQASSSFIAFEQWCLHVSSILSLYTPTPTHTHGRQRHRGIAAKVTTRVQHTTAYTTARTQQRMISCPTAHDLLPEGGIRAFRCMMHYSISHDILRCVLAAPSSSSTPLPATHLMRYGHNQETTF